MSLKSHANIHGFPVYHAGNHNQQGDPHPQLVNKRDLSIIPYPDASHTYYKICTLKIIANDSYVMSNLLIYNFDNTASDNIEFANVILKLNCQGALGAGTRKAALLVVNQVNFDLSRLTAVISQDDATGLTVDLYFRQTVTTKKYAVQAITSTFNRISSSVTCNNNGAFETALPAGTQVTPKRFEDYGKITKVIPGKQVSDGSYIKLLEVKIQYSGSLSKAMYIDLLSGYGGSATVPYARLYFRVKGNGFGNAMYNELIMFDGDVYSPTNFTAVITENAGSKITVALYLNVTRNGEPYYMRVQEETDEGTDVYVQYPTPYIYEAALPAGTQLVGYGPRKVYISDMSFYKDGTLSNTITTANNLKVGNGAWNGQHFIMGNYHFWVDASDRLRIKNGVPYSDADGVVVGSQS